MNIIQAETITETVARLCQDACLYLGDDVIAAIKKARENEASDAGRNILDQILENADIAAREHIPLCQDCGATVVFMELGQDVNIQGGYLYDAVAQGVREGYDKGFLRKSMVRYPFSKRVNTGDNTPPVIHTDIVPGDRLKLTVAPKGGGSENMSAFTVLKPAQGRKGIVDFVVSAVESAGGNPCPPVIAGVGIGGTAERAMQIAKRSLLRSVGEPHADSEIAGLEDELLRSINDLGIGPQGFGGSTTALAVHVETFPCHIASLPVAVNLQCHSARHKEAVL